MKSYVTLPFVIRIKIKDCALMENEALSGNTGEERDLICDYPLSQPGLSNSYIPFATSMNTRKACQSDIRHYEMAGGKLPATPEHIANYLHYYANKLNPRTLARRLIALRSWHSTQGFIDPTSHPAIQKTKIGIMRTHGKPKEKAPALTPFVLA